MNFLSLTLVSTVFVCVFAANVYEQILHEDGQLQDVDANGPRTCRARKMHVTVYCCYRNTYRLVVFERKLNACLRMRAIAHRNETRLIFSLNHKIVFNSIVSMNLAQKKVCRSVPGVVSNICLDVEFVDYKRRVVCAKMYGQMKVGWKIFQADHDFSCFNLPSPRDIDPEVGLLEKSDIGNDPSLEEMLPANLDLEEGDLRENGDYLDDLNEGDDNPMIFIL